MVNIEGIIDLGSTIEGIKERYRFYTSTITYIHARIQEFFVGFGGGGGGGSKPDWKKVWPCFFLFFFL